MEETDVTADELLALAKARGLVLADHEVPALQSALAEQRRAFARIDSAAGDTTLEPATSFDARWSDAQAGDPRQRRRAVRSPLIPSPLYPTYSQGVTVPVGDSTLLFIAGQVAPAVENDAPNDLRWQVACCYEQIKVIIEAAGGQITDLVQTTAYLTDIAFLADVAAVRADFVGDPPPASTVVEVAALARPDLLFEIEGIAVFGRH